MHAAIRAGDVSQMDHLDSAVNAATSIMATISRTSTWPWRPDTLRGFVSAIGLPVLLWVITATLGKVL